LVPAFGKDASKDFLLSRKAVLVIWGTIEAYLTHILCLTHQLADEVNLLVSFSNDLGM
jgi:hypothetical protein